MDSIVSKLELDVKVPETWIDFVLHSNLIFRKSHCGYWLRGVCRPMDSDEWLVYDYVANEEVEGDKLAELQCKAIQAFDNHEPLPNHWFRLNQEVAIKAYHEGIKKWGLDWYSLEDTSRYDVAIQYALFDTQRYS